jgi:hypothetical protein
MSDAKMPKRWSVGNYDGYMVERDGGDYVEAEDVEPLVAEITRLRAENIHLRRAGMNRPSAELHEAALAELRAEIERLRSRVEELERTLRRTSANLMAATSLLKAGGRDAAPSDKMFRKMLNDYEKPFRTGERNFWRPSHERRLRSHRKFVSRSVRA